MPQLSQDTQAATFTTAYFTGPERYRLAVHEAANVPLSFKQTPATNAMQSGKRMARAAWSLRERIRAARLSPFEAKLPLPSTCSPRAPSRPLERMQRFSLVDFLPSELALGQRQEAGEAKHEGREQ